MKLTPTDLPPDIEDALQRFAKWRQTKTPGDPTPADLRCLFLDLDAKYPRKGIAKILGVNSTHLKKAQRRLASNPKVMPDVVRVAPIQVVDPTPRSMVTKIANAPSSVIAEVKFRNGTSLTIFSSADEKAIKALAGLVQGV